MSNFTMEDCEVKEMVFIIIRSSQSSTKKRILAEIKKTLPAATHDQISKALLELAESAPKTQ